MKILDDDPFYLVLYEEDEQDQVTERFVDSDNYVVIKHDTPQEPQINETPGALCIRKIS